MVSDFTKKIINGISNEIKNCVMEMSVMEFVCKIPKYELLEKEVNGVAFKDEKLNNLTLFDRSVLDSYIRNLTDLNGLEELICIIEGYIILNSITSLYGEDNLAKA